MKKRLLSSLIILVFGVILSSCSKSETIISVLLYDANDTYISEMKSDFENQNIYNYSLKIYDCQKSQKIQNELLIKTINKTDVYYINLVDRDSAGSILLKTREKHIPVIFFNREPSQSYIINSNEAYYVGSDSIDAGKKQAEAFDLTYKQALNNGIDLDTNKDGIINTVVLKGEENHQDSENRTSNSIARLKELGYSLSDVKMYVCNWSNDIAYKYTKKILEENPKVELVLSNNDDMALGMIKYLEEHKLFEPTYSVGECPPISIVGFDGTVFGQKSIDSGQMLATVLNDAKLQVKVIYDLTNKLLTGYTNILSIDEVEVKNERYFYCPNKVIIKESV